MIYGDVKGVPVYKGHLDGTNITGYKYKPKLKTVHVFRDVTHSKVNTRRINSSDKNYITLDLGTDGGDIGLLTHFKSLNSILEPYKDIQVTFNTSNIVAYEPDSYTKNLVVRYNLMPETIRQCINPLGTPNKKLISHILDSLAVHLDLRVCIVFNPIFIYKGWKSHLDHLMRKMDLFEEFEDRVMFFGEFFQMKEDCFLYFREKGFLRQKKLFDYRKDMVVRDGIYQYKPEMIRKMYGGQVDNIFNNNVKYANLYRDW